MKFRTENEFIHFKFSDVHVSDIMMSFGEEIEETDYLDTFNNFLDGYAYLIEKENENYTFVFDGTDERSYTLIVSASKDECEWDRFMNIEA